VNHRSRVSMNDCVIIRWGVWSEEQDFAITVGYTSGKWNRVISGRPVHPTRGYWNSSYARTRSILLSNNIGFVIHLSFITGKCIEEKNL